MKLNKEQRLALVTRIKQLAKEEQSKFIEQVERLGYHLITMLP